MKKLLLVSMILMLGVSFASSATDLTKEKSIVFVDYDVGDVVQSEAVAVDYFNVIVTLDNDILHQEIWMLKVRFEESIILKNNLNTDLKTDLFFLDQLKPPSYNNINLLKKKSISTNRNPRDSL